MTRLPGGQREMPWRQRQEGTGPQQGAAGGRNAFQTETRPTTETEQQHGRRQTNPLPQLTLAKFFPIRLLVQYVPFRGAFGNPAGVGVQAGSDQPMNVLFGFHRLRQDTFDFLQRLSGSTTQRPFRRPLKSLQNHVRKMRVFVFG